MGSSAASLVSNVRGAFVVPKCDMTANYRASLTYNGNDGSDSTCAGAAVVVSELKQLEVSDNDEDNVEAIAAQTCVTEISGSALNSCTSTVTYMHSVSDDGREVKVKPSVSSSGLVNTSYKTLKVHRFYHATLCIAQS